MYPTTSPRNAAMATPMITATMNEIPMCVVPYAAAYAPTAMKPAWPSASWPARPATTVSPIAASASIPTVPPTVSW